MSARALSAAGHAIERFALTPARATPLAALRIGLAIVLLIQAGLIAPRFHDLYDRTGVIQGPLRDALATPGLPHLGWLIEALAPAGLGEAQVLGATVALYLLSVVALLVGWWTRAAAVIAWLTHVTLMMSANGTNYGADMFAHIFLFYLIWVPAGAALSLDRHLGRAPPDPSPAARLSLRVIQIHLCIAYLAAGLKKAMGVQWWNGDAIWRSLMLPEYRQMDLSFLARHPWVPTLAGWSVLLVEIGYAVLIWPRRTRRLWVLATVGLHLGIVVFMSLKVFGLIMIAFTIAAFGVSAEPREARKQAA